MPIPWLCTLTEEEEESNNQLLVYNTFKTLSKVELKLYIMYLMIEFIVCVMDNTAFGTKLYIQVVGIPMGTNCAPLVADLSLFVMRGTL